MQYPVTKKVSKTEIYSDALSVLNSIIRPSFSAKNRNIIIEIKHNLQIMNILHQEINIVWVSSRCGIERNEVSDSLAKQVHNKNTNRIKRDL